MGIADEVTTEEHDSDQAKILERALRAERQRDEARKDAKRLERRIDELEAEGDILAGIDAVQVNAPTWTQKTSKAKHRATAWAVLSDWHFDEVVNPHELVGSEGEPLNAYNRRIAELRLRATFDGIGTLANDLCSGFAYDGLMLVLGGDMVSGSIHEELRETNETSVIDTVDHWIDPLAAGVAQMLDTFGKVHLVGVVGNHGRNTRKPRAKGRVRDNFDWLLYRQLVRHFARHDGFSCEIPDSADAYPRVYGHRHAVTHGDQARGGSGISGLLTPMSLLDHRKRKRDAAAGGGYSHMWVGHWHTYLTMGSVTVNGSGKGTDEYSFQGNFGHEPPQQAFAVITPEHNVTIQAPIYSQDRKKEGW